jgi:hypothetical protein
MTGLKRPHDINHVYQFEPGHGPANIKNVISTYAKALVDEKCDKCGNVINECGSAMVLR